MRQVSGMTLIGQWLLVGSFYLQNTSIDTLTHAYTYDDDDDDDDVYL
jgi:hypothetical protein